MKIWILFVCALAAGVSVNAWSNEWDDSWNDDYDDEWFRTQLEKLGIYSDEQKDADDGTGNISNLEKDQVEMDKVVEEDIKKFQENENDSKIDDYQFEDNRSEQTDKLEDPIAPIDNVDEENNQDASQEVNEDDYDDYALKVDDEFKSDSPEDEAPEAELKFSKEDDIAPLQPPQLNDEIKQIIEETEAIINEEEKKPNDYTDDEAMPENDELNKIMEETKSILEEENQKPNDFDNNKDVQEDDLLSEIMEETKAILEEDNQKQNDFARVQNNHDDDEQLHLLRESSDDADEINQDVPDKTIQTLDDNLEKEIDDNLSDNIVDNDEDTVDKVYEDLNEDLDQLFETLNKLTRSEDEGDEKTKPADVDYAVNSDESLDDKSDYENLSDSNLSDIFAQHSQAFDDENLNENQAAVEANDTEADLDANKIISQEANQSEEQVLEYINDALLSDDSNKEKKEDASNEQLVQLIKNFDFQLNENVVLEDLSDNHVVNEFILEYGETKVIESDNYPGSGYPTNRIVDWIVTGKGLGIELNVTDFDVDSALGDYLMVKPGQIDDSGVGGIIFSYHLNEPRAYRFTDVDRIFIRFDSKLDSSKLGTSSKRRFNLNLKMIAPLPEEPEPAPEPEPVLPEPRHTLTVMLGGLTLADFKDIQESFRLLVADMATMYINANGIDRGLNTTAEITQIILAAVCNVHWPGYEECVQVRFSVPLVYEEEDEDTQRLHESDLRTMWDNYVDTDPFAARLRQMGIEEFSVPNDSGVLTVWLVVALGVMVSAAMLAIALWRYSCFQDYTRMSADGDTDSLQEKRSSLYPTPHQMLPPLYADNDYRVDMGGHENRSYTRTNMYDLDSDEDVIVTRDRYTTDV